MAKRRRRKLTKAQARAEAQRRRRQQQIIWAVAGVAVVAVIVVVVLIAISGGESAELVEVEPLRDDLETGVTAEGYPYRGPADAPVTIVEYSDYNCPVCGEFNLSTAELIDDQLIATGQTKYVVQHYALWEESIPVVEAAICAREQDAFWDFHHLLFANQALFSTRQPPSRGLLRQFAEAVGLDVDTFDACLDQGRRDEVVAASQVAKVELEVTSTPTFFVNGQRTQLLREESFFDTLRKAVEAAEIAGSSGQE
jgi:protein-disulfide isomerase